MDSYLLSQNIYGRALSMDIETINTRWKQEKPRGAKRKLRDKRVEREIKEEKREEKN